MTQRYDAVVVGAGAAGLFCAARAGQHGLSVLLIDHFERIAEKIRISGGGRCNFTNIDTGPANFDSANPDFCRSALARYTPRDFIALVERHGIAWHEKHKGQLFCDGSSAQIVDMLLDECAAGGVERWQPCSVAEVRPGSTGYALDTSRGTVEASQLVVATGGLSIPKIGASDWGHRLARRLGHRIVEPRPSLVPFTIEGAAWNPFETLAGLALPVRVETELGPRGGFLEDLLFTHRGLSGPAALQISTYWRAGQPLAIDLIPDSALVEALHAAKRLPRKRLGAALAEAIPKRLASAWLAGTPELAERFVADVRDRDLAALAAGLQHWSITPGGTEGWRKAEVTAGGVDTRDLESRSGESRLHPGLFFVGEVVDVTGWLGGYNFQWAWASAAACATRMAERCEGPHAGL